MRFFTSTAFALAATLSLSLMTATASAEPARAATHSQVRDGAHGKKFPMAGTEFKQKIDQRIVTARQKL